MLAYLLDPHGELDKATLRFVRPPPLTRDEILFEIPLYQILLKRNIPRFFSFEKPHPPPLCFIHDFALRRLNSLSLFYKNFLSFILFNYSSTFW